MALKYHKTYKDYCEARRDALCGARCVAICTFVPEKASKASQASKLSTWLPKHEFSVTVLQPLSAYNGFLRRISSREGSKFPQVFAVLRNNPAYVSIRQHTSACASIRQHRKASNFITCLRCSGIVLRCSRRQHTQAYVSVRPRTSAYDSVRQRTTAYVSIRQRTTAFVSIRHHISASVSIGDLRWRGQTSSER